MVGRSSSQCQPNQALGKERVTGGIVVTEIVTEHVLSESQPRVIGRYGGRFWGEEKRLTVSAEPDRFVGRQDELRRCAELLSDSQGVRVVTLTGLGGTGKTRLGQRAARQNASGYHDGTIEVQLAGTAPGAGAEEIAAAVAASLGLDNQAGLVPSLQRTQHFLAGRRVLLLLDGCEHVLEAVREVVDVLVATCPGVAVLATSRVPLNVVGENLFPVPELRVRDAIELFETRAAAVGADLASDTGRGRVRDIVSFVDCVPLSVEILGRQMRYMSAETLLVRLRQRRPQGEDNSLEDILRWHDELCSPAERELWRQLSVFRGGFTLDAAEGVCADAESQDDVLTLLSGLIDKSIVSFTSAAQRYSMLDRVREYGERQLRSVGKEHDARLRHLQHYRRQQEERARHWFSAREVVYLQKARSELPNLRAALTFAVDNDLAEPALALWTALCRIRAWTWTGLLGESARWLDQIFELPSSTCIASEQRAVALTRAAKNVFFAGDQQRAKCLTRRAEDEAGATVGRVGVAINHAIAVKHMFVDLESKSIQEHHELMRQAAAEGFDDDEQFMLRLYLALATGMYGSYEQAEEEGRALKEAAVAAGAEWMITWAQWPLANAEIRFGELAAARARLRSALHLQAQWGERWGPLWFVEGIGWSHPNPIEAARILGAARALQVICGSEISGIGGWYLQHTNARDRIVKSIGQREYDRAFESGRNMSSYSEIVELALRDPELTNREQEVASLVVMGLSNKEIAEKLTVSPRTAETHVANILSKLGISQRQHVADFLPAKE